MSREIDIECGAELCNRIAYYANCILLRSEQNDLMERVENMRYVFPGDINNYIDLQIKQRGAIYSGDEQNSQLRAAPLRYSPIVPEDEILMGVIPPMPNLATRFSDDIGGLFTAKSQVRDFANLTASCSV